VEIGIRIGWNKFGRLVPLLASGDKSLMVGGRLCGSCVWGGVLHGSGTWPVGGEDGVALRGAVVEVVRWMCGVGLQDGVPSGELGGDWV